MSDSDNRQRITVETLLQLKRNERPSPEFWDSFDRDFARRRLHELVNRPSLYDLLVRPAVRILALAMPVTAVIVAALLWKPVERSTPQPLLIEQEIAGVTDTVVDKVQPDESPRESVATGMAIADSGKVSNQFVLDAIQEQSQAGLRFRKVLYTPAIRLSVPSGSSYVRDSFSSSNYRVTTADAKLGRNF